jgi:DNA polymerase III delta prime subunit
MTSFVIAGRDKKKRIAYAQEMCRERKIGKFDISVIEKETSKQTSQSIGIEDIKRIQRALFFKPIKSQTKAVIIEDAHLLTPEAQNALLKVLEEPPLHTIIILAADTTESLLPTILSRCQIIALETEQTELSENEREGFETFVQNLATMSIGERLKKAEQLAKDKNATVAWIGKFILVLRDDAIANVANETGIEMTNYIRSFQTLQTRLKTTNVNPRFAIESTLLAL